MREKINTLYMLLITHRQKIINIFNITYLLLSVFTVGAFIFFRNDTDLLPSLLQTGTLFGKSALIAYVITLLPGMGERIGVNSKILSVIRIYRRYIGILMYTLSLAHFALVRILFITSPSELLPRETFEAMGTMIFATLFLLFLTSNNTSMSRLKIWWYRTQRLTYVAMFFIFLHVAFIRVSVWSVLMGLVIILQAITFYVVYKKTNTLTGRKPA